MVNGSGRIFVERAGRLEAIHDVTVREQNLRVAVRNLACALGDDISDERPILDARLSDERQERRCEFLAAQEAKHARRLKEISAENNARNGRARQPA